MPIKSGVVYVFLFSSLMILFCANSSLAITNQDGKKLKLPNEIKKSGRSINQNHYNNLMLEEQRANLAIPNQYSGKEHRKKQRKELHRMKIRPYMAFGIRGAILQDMELESNYAIDSDGNVDNNPNISNIITTDLGVGFSGAGGAYLENGLRIEFEFAKTYNKIDTVEQNGSELSGLNLQNLHPNVEMTTYMVNVFYDSVIKESTKWGPYFGAGAGAGSFDMNIVDSVSGGEYADTTWAAQAMIGLSYKINPKGSALYAGYRYLGTGAIEYKVTGINDLDPSKTKQYDIEQSYSNNILEIGFRGNF